MTQAHNCWFKSLVCFHWELLVNTGSRNFTGTGPLTGPLVVVLVRLLHYMDQILSVWLSGQTSDAFMVIPVTVTPPPHTHTTNTITTTMTGDASWHLMAFCASSNEILPASCGSQPSKSWKKIMKSLILSPLRGVMVTHWQASYYSRDSSGKYLSGCLVPGVSVATLRSVCSDRVTKRRHQNQRSCEEAAPGGLF